MNWRRYVHVHEVDCSTKSARSPRSLPLGLQLDPSPSQSATSSLSANKPMTEPMNLARLIGAGQGRVVATREHVLRLDEFPGPQVSAPDLGRFEGRSAVLFVREMAKAAAALIELDGWARRIVLCPPGWDAPRLEAVVRSAERTRSSTTARTARRRHPHRSRAACRLPLHGRFLARREPWKRNGSCRRPGRTDRRSSSCTHCTR